MKPLRLEELARREVGVQFIADQRLLKLAARVLP
jgi:hypothetical protein